MISESDLTDIRSEVKKILSKYRYDHTLGVERAIIKLGEYYMPCRIGELRVAAILHDITKEMPTDEQISLIETSGIILSHDDRISFKTLHQTSGAVLAEKKFKKYVNPDIINAISKHSTGNEDMSIFDYLLYLADYIDDTRNYKFCIELRNKFYDGINKLSASEYNRFLYEIVLFSLDFTIKELIEQKAFIHKNTFSARNFIIEKLDIIKKA